MNNDLMEIIDKNYILLENMTNEEYARELFEKYLLGERIKGKFNEDTLSDVFEGLSRSDIITQIAKYSLILSNQCSFLVYTEFKNNLMNNNINPVDVVDYLYDDRKMLQSLIRNFIGIRYSGREHIDINNNIEDKELKKYIDCLGPTGKSDNRHSLMGIIRNFSFNKSRQDIIGNKQYIINRKEYSLGNNLFAVIDKGNDDLSQEDSVLLLKHPDNNKFKIIAVADGDSSKMYGEEASNYALYSIIKWFEDLDQSYFFNIDALKKIVESELTRINCELQRDSTGKATTIALAIIGDEKTLISSIGDTKVFIIKNNKIEEETKDDSYVQRLSENGLIDPQKSKFHKAVDILTNELGIVIDKDVIPNNTKIINNNYDKLLVLTDGITRLVNNDTIEEVIKDSKDNKIVNRLVEKAKTSNKKLDEIDLYCNSEIKPNQNNMTAAIYIKRR